MFCFRYLHDIGSMRIPPDLTAPFAPPCPDLFRTFFSARPDDGGRADGRNKSGHDDMPTPCRAAEHRSRTSACRHRTRFVGRAPSLSSDRPRQRRRRSETVFVRPRRAALTGERKVAAVQTGRRPPLPPCASGAADHPHGRNASRAPLGQGGRAFLIPASACPSIRNAKRGCGRSIRRLLRPTSIARADISRTRCAGELLRHRLRHGAGRTSREPALAGRAAPSRRHAPKDHPALSPRLRPVQR